MKEISKRIVIAVFVLALTIPAVAYASSYYVRKSPTSTAYSSGSMYVKQANQGSVEDGGVAGMYSTIQSYNGSSWTNRITKLAYPNGSNSSSVAYNGNLYRWRLMLSGWLSAGYGIINAY